MRIPTGARRIPRHGGIAPAEAQQGVLRVRERAQDGPCRARLRLKAGRHLCGGLRPGGYGVLDVLRDSAVDLQLPELVPAKQLRGVLPACEPRDGLDLRVCLRGRVATGYCAPAGCGAAHCRIDFDVPPELTGEIKFLPDGSKVRFDVGCGLGDDSRMVTENPL